MTNYNLVPAEKLVLWKSPKEITLFFANSTRSLPLDQDSAASRTIRKFH